MEYAIFEFAFIAIPKEVSHFASFQDDQLAFWTQLCSPLCLINFRLSICVTFGATWHSLYEQACAGQCQRDRCRGQHGLRLRLKLSQAGTYARSTVSAAYKTLMHAQSSDYIGMGHGFMWLLGVWRVNENLNEARAYYYAAGELHS